MFFGLKNATYTTVIKLFWLVIYSADRNLFSGIENAAVDIGIASVSLANHLEDRGLENAAAANR